MLESEGLDQSQDLYLNMYVQQLKGSNECCTLNLVVTPTHQIISRQQFLQKVCFLLLNSFDDKSIVNG